MLDWNVYRDELKSRIGEIGKLSPDTVRGYATLSGAGAKTQHLDAKTRELIGPGRGRDDTLRRLHHRPRRRRAQARR